MSNQAPAVLLSDALLENQPVSVLESEDEGLGFLEGRSPSTIGLEESGGGTVAVCLDFQIGELNGDLSGPAQSLPALLKPGAAGHST